MAGTDGNKAVILLSGGLDSAVSLAKAIRDGRECHALTFRYGQRHAIEIEAASRIARALGVAEHRILELDLRSPGGSSLLGEGDIPKGRDLDDRAIPSTYVPARNTIFLALALGWAETLDADEIWIGVNEVDTSGYPDTRPEFIAAFERLAGLATRRGVEGRATRIVAPLLGLDKAAIVRLGMDLGVDFSLTWSCYSPGPGPTPCGECDSCRLRVRGFEAAGVPDPLATHV